MEAFSYGVVFGEAPHQCDRFDPLFKGSGEGLKGREAGVFEVMDMPEQCLDMVPALLLGLSFMFH